MKKYYKFELNMILMNILVIVIYIGIYILCGVFNPSLLNLGTNTDAALFFLGMIGYFILHEIVHGIGYSIFAKDKKNIKFGIMLERGVLYAMCQEEISRKGIIVSLLLPIFVLTFFTGIIGTIFHLNFLINYSILNLVGAIGDITMFIFLLRLPKDITYIDYDNVIGAYFISDEDLSKYSSKSMKFIESGKHNKSLINKELKRIYISKTSLIILVLTILLLGIIIL